jgi:NADPH:quinone reductase-like Zn-dependent oxidoreductase
MSGIDSRLDSSRPENRKDTSLKAVRIHEFGGTDVLQVEDVEDPDPPEGHVRLKIAACALNHVDVDIREGVSRFPIEFPLILGLEIVGTVDKLGANADGLVKKGDRVMPYLLGGDVFLGVGGDGGYAEYVTCPPSQLVKIPDEIDDWTQAASLQVAFATSWHMLFTRGGLRIGETVLVNSVSAGIGSAAVQLAKLAGATVIGTSSSAEKLEAAADLGMDVGINYNEQNVSEAVMEITGGKGVDLVYEHVGGELFKKGLESLRPRGRLVTCGAHSGEVVPFDVIPFFRSEWTVVGSFVYTRDEVESVLDFARRGLLKPQVAATYPLTEVRAAFDRMESREFFGKLVLVP